MLPSMLTRRTTLRGMVERGAPIQEIAAHLDQLAGADRVDEVRSVRGKLIGRLYDLATGPVGLGLDDVVAAGSPSGTTITFEGRNSLPAFSVFRKRFTRTADGLVFGHNEGVTAPLTGPGYFAVVASDAASEGELLFDYTRPPPFEPAGWPRYVPNGLGASRLVFGDLHDYVRRVARGVMVGSAYKHGVRQDAWFTLTLPR